MTTETIESLRADLAHVQADRTRHVVRADDAEAALETACAERNDARASRAITQSILDGVREALETPDGEDVVGHAARTLERAKAPAFAHEDRIDAVRFQIVGVSSASSRAALAASGGNVARAVALIDLIRGVR